ncbi:hypothetical protein HDC94_001614 [Leifsonia sp. AK011]|uniref:hypothetical protein n=1 Tax=Leifsonia sp. AK011 TaxID=2723075 RepID=UPI0015CD9188|nr:hypothetical protein [Leifsonia sp. AK011]NYF10458.1 hypothetical protein [Leifsonia sp. AK011]
MENSHEPEQQSGQPFPPPLPPPPAPVPQISTPHSPQHPTPVYAPPLSKPGAQSGRTAAIVVAIVVGSIVLLGGLGVAFYVIAHGALSAMDSASSDLPADAEFTDLPLVPGEPGPSTAVAPLECPEQCFTSAALDRILLDSSTYRTLGVGSEGEYTDDEYATTTADQEFLELASYWKDEASSPDQCFFATLWSPISDTVDSRPESPDDLVRYHTAWYSESEYSTLTHSTRLFTTTAGATGHMTALRDHVGTCTSYALGGDEAYWEATVTPMPAVDLPDSIAAVGWVEQESYGSRVYVADLQRGNLVVRVNLYTEQEISEEAFRDYLVAASEHLAKITVQ